MRFQWDEDKNEANRIKHGIAFEDVLGVFDDPMLVVVKGRIDPKTLEQRWYAIGRPSESEEAVLFVVHVYRGTNEEEIIRIISARKASKRERREYFS